MLFRSAGDDQLNLTAGPGANYHVADGYRGPKPPTLTVALNLSVFGGTGNDVASIGFSRLQGGSELNVNLDMGAGDDKVEFQHVQPDSKLTANVNLGDGNDQATFVVWLYRDPRSRSHTTIGSATVNLYGGNGQDGLFARTVAGEPDYSGSSTLNLSLGMYGESGDDYLSTRFDTKIRVPSSSLSLDESELASYPGDQIGRAHV